MRRFHCRCGHAVYYDNSACIRCGANLGFDIERLEMLSVQPEPGGHLLHDIRAPERRYRHCANRTQHQVCNWLVPADDPQPLCASCRLNSVIPNLGVPRNLLLWARLEAAKRRLLYDLTRLGLRTGRVAAAPELRFEFLEDQRSNPDVLESFVSTGHIAGTITINVAEADHSARTATREELGERYRTLLGHFRHESGHYYFERLVGPPAVREEFRQLFGDERADYGAALTTYYAVVTGSPADWRYITTYARAHPHEDWAESWAHYLHIQDALETAAAWGIAGPPPDDASDWIECWIALAVPLNELNRSLGGEDVYPFVLTPSVATKLRFIHRRVASAAPAPAASASDRKHS
jgi:hypothetical protein